MALGRSPYLSSDPKPPAPGTPGGGAPIGNMFLNNAGQPTVRTDTYNYVQAPLGGGGGNVQSGPSSSGSGGGGSIAAPPREPAPGSVGREADVSIGSSASGLGQLDEQGRAAQSAVFGRAKDRAGQIANSALSGLRSALASRGVLGSGMEVQGTVDAAMQGAGLIGDVSREEAIQEAQRGERAREFQTQAQLQQRGQNIGQRGQDLGQLLGVRGQDITQRGQDISLQGLKTAASSGGSGRPYGGGDPFGFPLPPGTSYGQPDPRRLY